MRKKGYFDRQFLVVSNKDLSTSDGQILVVGNKELSVRQGQILGAYNMELSVRVAICPYKTTTKKTN